MLIYINFNFDFLGLDNICVRVVSDIQTLAFGSSLYIRYNTAAHVVNSTSRIVIVIVEKNRYNKALYHFYTVISTIIKANARRYHISGRAL